METFLECVASHHLDTCSWEVWQKSTEGKWQKCCIVSITKNNASATHFFALSPKPIARFRWKRARLSLFTPQPYLPSFIQIHPSFRDLLAKATFQIRHRIANNQIRTVKLQGAKKDLGMYGSCADSCRETTSMSRLHSR